MTARIKTGFWIRALLRRISSSGRSAMVIRRGDEDAGAVLVTLIDREGGVSLLREETAPDTGARGWMRVPVADQAELDAYVERQRGYDPDLWVIEIEVARCDAPIERELGTRYGDDGGQ